MNSFSPFAIVLALFAVVMPARSAQDLTNSSQKISYALGMDVVRVLKMDEFDIDMKTIVLGMTDMQAGKPALTPAQKKAAMKEMQDDILARAVAKKEAAGAIHRQEGAAFLAANAKLEGVKVKVATAPDGSKAELEYKILKTGAEGASPKMTDTVVVDFTGKLIDGTEFDSSTKRGGPTAFSMTEVIPGWAEALQVMKPGDKWKLFIPPGLAYADYGPPEIGMYTTLVYEIELVSFSATNDSSPTPFALPSQPIK